MAKISFVGLAVATVFLITTDRAEAKEASKGHPAVLSPASAEKIAVKAAKEKEAAALLNGTIWSIEWTPLSGGKPKKPLKDTLTFENGKVTSETLSRDGYPTSNYTLTVGEDGVTVWETMQTKEKTGVVFWRGERQGDTMRGILSKQPADGPPVDHSFSGRLVETKQPAPAVPPPPSTAPETHPGGKTA